MHKFTRSGKYEVWHELIFRRIKQFGQKMLIQWESRLQGKAGYSGRFCFWPLSLRKQGIHVLYPGDLNTPRFRHTHTHTLRYWCFQWFWCYRLRLRVSTNDTRSCSMRHKLWPAELPWRLILGLKSYPSKRFRTRWNPTAYLESHAWPDGQTAFFGCLAWNLEISNFNVCHGTIEGLLFRKIENCTTSRPMRHSWSL